MSSKLVNKKLLTRNRNVSRTRTPIKTIANSQSSGMGSQTEVFNTISVNEHKKVLARNNCLAKENASLRDQIRLLKNELMALKANEINQQILDSHQTLDLFCVALNCLSNEYNTIRDKFNDLGTNVQNVRIILSECSAELHRRYPEFSFPSLLDYSESTDGINGLEHDCRGMDYNNSRHSLSSQERESIRRLSLERIKREFHIHFPELSTILEQSREQRSSSVNFGRESIHRMSAKFNDMASRVCNASKSNLKSRTSDVTPIHEESREEIDVIDGKKETSMSRQSNQTKGQKLPFRDSTNSQTMNRSNNSNLSTNLCQVYDIHNKENIIPSELASNANRFSLNVFDLAPPQHSSSPNGPIRENVGKNSSNLIDFSLNDRTIRNSSATVLVEETRCYPKSSIERRFGQSLKEVMETPQICITDDLMTERMRSDAEVFESEAIPIVKDVGLDVSEVAIDLMPNQNTAKSVVENQKRSKRLRRKPTQNINYAEICDLENESEDEVRVKRKPKKKTTQTNTENKTKSGPKTRNNKNKSESTQQTDDKKKKEKSKENKSDLEKRLSVFDFEEEENTEDMQRRAHSKTKRTKAKK